MLKQKPTKMNTKNIIRYSLILILIFSFINETFSQENEWVVPDDKNELVSNFQFTTESIENGESFYQKNCLSCHGEPTKGNYAALQPSPGDPASERYQNQTDGAMFYRITEGRGLMPKFKNILSDKERWEIIAYIRSFNEKYVQPPLAKLETFKGDKARLELSFDETTKTIIAKVIGTVNKKEAPVNKAEVVLFVKRYFGNMQVNESLTTNENGIAEFKFPDDLPGNDSGYIEVIAKLSDASQFGEIEQTAFINSGIPRNKEKLTSKRAMWNITRKAPIWLLVTYFGVILLVWSFIIYIVLQIIKLRKIGKEALLSNQAQEEMN